MDAEKWLKDNCYKEDWDNLTDENLNDFISTNNVIKYMERFSILESCTMSGVKKIKEFISLIEEEPEIWEVYKAHNPERINKLRELLGL